MVRLCGVLGPVMGGLGLRGGSPPVIRCSNLRTRASAVMSFFPTVPLDMEVARIDTGTSSANMFWSRHVMSQAAPVSDYSKSSTDGTTCSDKVESASYISSLRNLHASKQECVSPSSRVLGQRIVRRLEEELFTLLQRFMFQMFGADVQWLQFLAVRLCAGHLNQGE